LLAVLLIVAVMGAIAAAAFERLRLSTALAVNHASLEQARAYAVGVETLLALRADDLAAESPEATTLEGDWNGTLRRIPLPGEGLAEGTIRDGGNCFNLNGLVEGDSGTGYTARPAARLQIIALMGAVGASENQALRVAGAAADWADSDTVPGPNGAEDGAYAGAERPYRPANTLFAEVSELRAVAGMTPDLYAGLRPYLCALPTAEPSAINVNTLLPRDAPLLAMLAPGRLPLERARAVLAGRPASGWRRIEDFWRSFGEGGETLPLDARSQLQLITRWFALELRVEFNGAELIETALVDARLPPSRVVVRRWGRDE
jgi:general secretion pathway protein K